MAEHMITTVDNPFDPFTQWEEWYAFDERAGYHTTAFVARVLTTSHELSEADQLLAYELAVKEIADYNVLGIYKRVSRADAGDEYKDPALSMTA
jgi:hypothetical protein